MAKAAKDSETSSGTSAPSISRLPDKVLSKVDRPGTFFCKRQRARRAARSGGQGLGPVGLPLTAARRRS